MNISIREDVYRELKRRRVGDESFSEIIERLMARPTKLTDFIGAWGDMDEKEASEVEELRKSRRAADETKRGRLRARSAR